MSLKFETLECNEESLFLVMIRFIFQNGPCFHHRKYILHSNNELCRKKKRKFRCVATMQTFQCREIWSFIMSTLGLVRMSTEKYIEASYSMYIQ